MVQFTTGLGKVVDIDRSETQVVESNPNYQVLSAKNPNGGTLYATVYKNRFDGQDLSQTPSVVEDGGDGVSTADLHVTQEDSDQENIPPIDDRDDSERDNPQPKGTSRIIDWRNLRLQSAISGEAAIAPTTRVKNLAARASGIATGRKLSSDESIRDSPFLYLASSRDWYSYLRNMTIVDIGAEFSAGVSQAQKHSVALFTIEWENDPGHNGLVSRLQPGADTQEVIAKGQIAYDILTRGHDILGSKGYGPTNEQKMFKLAFDIISSMELRTYNYYTLYQLHPDEGDAIYNEFKNRYIPLGTSEVEMVNEMRLYLESEGDGYAFRTTNDEAMALQAAKLMKTAVASYSIGDTRTTRTALHSLGGFPYNYKPLSLDQTLRSKGGVDEIGANKNTSLTFVKLKVKDNSMRESMVKAGHAQRSGSNTIGVWALGLTPADMNEQDRQLIDSKSTKNTITLTTGGTSFVPHYIAKKQGGGGDANWTIIEMTNEMLRDGRNTRQGKNRRNLKKSLNLGSKKNPKARKNPKGRGKWYYIEFHPKRQLAMTMAEKKKRAVSGETLHGLKSPKSGYQKWTLGLHKHPAFFVKNKKTGKSAPGQIVQHGIHKKTGDERPYRIRVPTTHFKPKFVQSVGYKTLVPHKDLSNKALWGDWDKFIKRYGHPKHSPTKDTHYRFIIPKAAQQKSPYYKEVRKLSAKSKKR
tara:strand:+ start:7299 stop:9383 length:2085 start_codon:yes stop_codon:yes gene_type:complete